MVETLSERQLNRTTLSRQWLLDRRRASAVETVAHLVAVQAQESNSPYLGLWARLTDSTREELTAALWDRAIVRSSVLRGTQHIVAAGDFRWLRRLLQPVLARAGRAAFGRDVAAIDLDELTEAGRAALAGRTLTRPQLTRELAARWPIAEPAALGWTVQMLLPIVHPPPSGTWDRRGATPFVLADDWLDPAPADDHTRDTAHLVRRYLAAFGPASIKDVQVWSGLTRLREVVEGMELRRYRDPDGVPLFDLPEGTLREADEPAPVRFVPEFDNLLVGHADRRRIMSDEARRRVITGSVVRPVILVDGYVRGTWTVTRDAVVTVTPFAPLTAAETAAVEAEGAALVSYLGGDGSITFGDNDT